MSSEGSSFELFGLMVKVPSDTVVEALGGCSTYLPKYSPKYAVPPVPETSPSLPRSQINAVPEHEISVRHSFDEMVSEQPSERKKTFVVLDCANIGWAHGENHFSSEGIRIALAFFARYNVDIAAFIPSSYLKRKPSNGSKGNSVMETDDWEQLAVLVRTGDVTVVPAGDHDDVYILSFARSNNGFIVSNDFFADHITGIEEKSIQKSMKLWLNVNRCGFTFMKNASFMINPGNVLSTVLGHLHFQERISDFGKSQSIIINTLTSTIQVVLQLEGFMQLKYLLLARAASYMEVIL
jgi:Zc3h12a-like Ribonuclease NYN domain